MSNIRFGPSGQGQKIAFLGLTSVSALCLFASLWAIPWAAMMFLFNDTSLAASELERRVLVTLPPIGLFAALALLGMICFVKASRRRVLALAAIAVATCAYLAVVPGAGMGMQFFFGLVSAVATGG